MMVAVVHRLPRLKCTLGSVRSMMSMELVKKLRDRSGAPIMDCKKALENADVQGNMDKALDWLRKKGMSVAQSKANRVAAEGLVAVHVDGLKCVIVEVNSETDFVARNDTFRSFVGHVCEAALNTSSHGTLPIESLLALTVPSTGTIVQDALSEVVARIRENIVVRRAYSLEIPRGVIASYVHAAVESTVPMGRAAAVVALTCDNPSQEVMDIGKRLAMHVVAAKPRFLDESSIPQSVIEHERSVLEAQVSGSNKPANIIEKMIQGRLKKFIGEISLLGQSHMIVEGNPQIAQFLKEQSIQLGTQVRVEHFIRMQIGEEDQ